MKLRASNAKRRREEERRFGFKVPCRYLLTAIGEFVLLRYLSGLTRS